MKTFSQKVGANLKILRLESEMTQLELSEKIGVHSNTLQSWELGTRLLPVMVFDKLGKALNLHPHKLFERIYPT